MWVLKPIWAYANAKYGSCMPRNGSKIFNVKVIHNPCNCEPLSKIGRLLTWKLFQELESAVHWSDGYIMLIGFSLWTWWYFIFWWSLIRIVWYTAVFSVVTQSSCLLRSVFERNGKISRDFEQILGQIVSLRVNTLSNTNLAASRHINKKKAYISLKNVSQKTSMLKLDIDFECDNIGCSFPDSSRH